MYYFNHNVTEGAAEDGGMFCGKKMEITDFQMLGRSKEKS
jgi:hypothetical protein